MISVGNKQVKQLFLGSKPIKEVYLGDKKIYSSGLSGWVTVFDTPTSYIANKDETIPITTLNKTPKAWRITYRAARKVSGDAKADILASSYYYMNSEGKAITLETDSTIESSFIGNDTTPVLNISGQNNTGTNRSRLHIYINPTEIYIRTNFRRESGTIITASIIIDKIEVQY